MKTLLLLLHLLLFIATPSFIAPQPIDEGGCPISRPQLSPHPQTPTWQASFPGSGARMTFNLIQALTGLHTGDDYNSHNFGYEHVVTVKTHYPVKIARGNFHAIDAVFHKAIVLLRNPINAIPSYYNLLYERSHHLPNHSTRGSNQEWIEYRDNANHGLQYQLERYEQFIVYWIERFREDRGNLLLVSYEELSGEHGHVEARRIIEFLKRDNDHLQASPDRIDCVWRKVVKFDGIQSPQDFNMERKANPHSLREGPRDRPYKQHQLDNMIGVLKRLIEKFSHDDEFIRIVRGYIDVVSSVGPEL